MIDIAIVIALIAITIIIGATGYGVSRSMVGYFLAGRGLGAWVLSFSFMATYFSAASFIAGGGATYLFNLGFGAWLTAWHVIGVVLAWVLVAERLYKYASKTGIISISDFVGHRYQSTMAKATAAVVIIFLFVLYASSVFMAGAKVLSVLLDTTYEVGLLLLLIPVVIYVGLGGLKATALNNLILGVLMLVAAILTFSYVMSAVGGWEAGIAAIERMKIAGRFDGTLWTRIDGFGPPPAMTAGMVPALIMGVTFSISIAQVALPQLLMQFYAARDVRVINYGRIISPIAVSLYAILVFSLGVFGHLILDPAIPPGMVGDLLKDPDRVIPMIVMRLMPPGVSGLVAASILAASISTLAVVLIVLSASLVRDIIQTAKPGTAEPKLVAMARVMPLIFALIAMGLAFSPPGIIVEVVGAAFGTIFACFVGPVTIGLYWKGATKAGTIASMVSGLVIGLTWFLFIYRKFPAPTHPLAWVYPVVPALVISLLLFFLVSFFTKKPPKEVLDLLG
ncbi:MAG: sodium/solute symporter [Candidatus Nezhaarchaeota archaeon]|nr:sodium/solute symporter [Candidatus Nezhaarchaeota archaeon]